MAVLTLVLGIMAWDGWEQSHHNTFDFYINGYDHTEWDCRLHRNCPWLT